MQFGQFVHHNYGRDSSNKRGDGSAEYRNEHQHFENHANGQTHADVAAHKPVALFNSKSKLFLIAVHHHKAYPLSRDGKNEHRLYGADEVEDAEENLEYQDGNRLQHQSHDGEAEGALLGINKIF